MVWVNLLKTSQPSLEIQLKWELWLKIWLPILLKKARVRDMG